MSDLVLKEKDGTKKTYVGVKQIKIKKADGGFETFINPSGTKVIEDNGLHDVREFESVDIKVSGGDCPGRHIIEVDKLPYENIDSDSLYLYNGTYYEPVRSAFVDIIAYDPARGPLSLLDDLPEEVEEVVLYILPEKTSNAEVSDMATRFHFYFIRKENDIFVYTDTWHRLSEIEGLPGHGMITDTSEATQEGYYALFDPDAWGLEPLTTGSGGGSSGGGGAELNIAYGDTAPADTTQLWVKTTVPNKVIISSSYEDSPDNRDTSTTTAKAELPIDLFYVGASKAGTKIYLFGGYNMSTGVQNSIFCFDIITETITTLAVTLPYACCGIACATVGTKIYLFYGRTNRYPTATDQTVCKDVWVFDTTTQTIVVRSASEALSNDEITGRCCATVGEKIYLFGGYAPSRKQYLPWCSIFNATTEKFEYSSVSLPLALYDCYCSVVGTKIYISSGKPASGINYAIFCYDTVTSNVSTLPTSLPNDGYVYRVMASVGEKLYFFGGYSGTYKEYPTSKCYCYDLETNTLEQTVSLTKGIDFSQAVTAGDDVFIFGCFGSGAVGKTIHKFLAPVKAIALESGSLQIIPTTDINAVPIVNSEAVIIEICVGKVYKGNAENKAEQVEAALYKDNDWTII